MWCLWPLHGIGHLSYLIAFLISVFFPSAAVLLGLFAASDKGLVLCCL